MRELNRRYLGYDRTTDVLSFPQQGALISNDKMIDAITDKSPMPLGDIAVNLHQAARQAAVYGVPLSEEVSRLLIHGLLHLLGYDHERNQYQAKRMKQLEAQLLRELL
jgi:probable rRNA maturation factor